MPIREYIASESEQECCPFCQAGFEEVESIDCEPLTKCPECGGAVERQISATQIGGSKSTFNDRAKRAGFTKLEKLGSKEYEKKY